MASVKIASILGREEEAICVCFCALANWLAERVAHAGMVFFTFFSFSLDGSFSLRKETVISKKKHCIKPNEQSSKCEK